jgi:hypothetical protein
MCYFVLDEKRKIKIMNNGKLFVSYALGRIYSGTIGGVIGIIFLTWLVDTLHQQGAGAQTIASTIAGLVVTVMFSTKSIVKWAASRPYKLLVYYTICMLTDITIVFTCQSLPWIILGSSAFTSIGPTVFIQARAIMLNRVMAADELTLFKNRLDTLGILSTLAGSGLGMITPVSLDVVGWLSLAYLILILHANLWQIRELEKMPQLKLK